MKGYIAGAVVLALFLCFQPGNAIKCYLCNSFYDPGCGDWFDNTTYPLTQCGAEFTMCRKIVQETFSDGKWSNRVIRQCAHEGEVGRDEGRWCTERTGVYRVKAKYCQCDAKDGCNGAEQRVFSFFTILASVLCVLGVTLRSL